MLGEIKENNKGTKMKIIAQRSTEDIDVEFLDNYHYVFKHNTYQNFKSGGIKNPFDKTVYGVGYLGDWKYNGWVNGKPTVEYYIWQQISDWILHQLIEANKLSVIKNESLDLYCGMASGCDMVFGFISTLCKLAPKARLHCILPCKGYNSSHQYYEILKENADEWVELSDEFYKGCDNARDQYMVDHCGVLLAIWDGNKSGGVWSTIRKAQKAGKTIIYCPKELLEC